MEVFWLRGVCSGALETESGTGRAVPPVIIIVDCLPSLPSLLLAMTSIFFGLSFSLYWSSLIS